MKKKLMTMHKTLHPSDNIARQYVLGEEKLV